MDFVEWFSFFSNNSSDNRASNFIDTGLFIYVTPNIQLDVRVGERVSDRVSSIFSGAGLSLRFKRDGWLRHRSATQRTSELVRMYNRSPTIAGCENTPESSSTMFAREIS